MAFPASSQLPDEIIKEILSPALHVSDEAFADTALRASPFANYELSSSTILVVCKSWLRVATPLLYETVVLRSKAQAQALAGALKKNSQLGGFVKKLRIEGGYGNAVFEILKRSPHISDIWITTALWSNESVAGYAKGFRLISPRRLILVDDRIKTSKIRENVYAAVNEAMKEIWKELETAVFNVPYPDLERASGLIDTVAQSPAPIEQLVLQGSHARLVSWVKVMERDSVKLVRVVNRLLSGVWQKPAFEQLRTTAFEQALRGDRALYDKVVYESIQSVSSTASFPRTNAIGDMDMMATPLDPNWKPLSSASREERDTIWTRILAYAMSPLSPGLAYPKGQCARSWQRIRAGLVRVCKEFNRLGTPLLYEAVMLPTTQSIVRLRASPHIQHIRELWFKQDDDVFLDGGLDTEAIGDLVETCRGLVMVSQAKYFNLGERDKGMPYSWNHSHPDIKLPLRALTALSKHSSRTLQHLNLGIGFDSESAESDILTQEFRCALRALGNLCELRSLSLCTDDFGPFKEAYPLAAVLPRDAFPKVERLSMSNNSLWNVTFLDALRRVALPSLQHATFRPNGYQSLDLWKAVLPFLDDHGCKINFLSASSIAGLAFSLLPNLSEWQIIQDCDSYRFEFLDCEETFLSLKTIKFSSYGLGEIAEALSSLDLSPFTALEAVQITTALEWPKAQRDIDKSVWVVLAERLKEKWNVNVLDKNGKAWIPRLKPATASRSRRK